jgi:hypothetical protein
VAQNDNVEFAAMAAPRPQLIVSDGGDWTDRMPEHDFLFAKMYSWYKKRTWRMFTCPTKNMILY